MSGSIPECIWSLPDPLALNLAGNGFTGKIPSSRKNLTSGLTSLKISHNYLSGKIPLWLQETPHLRVLDLSHNKLSGESVTLFHRQHFNPNASKEYFSLKLAVNRLSGQLPTSYDDSYKTLDLLSGNLFGCRNLPVQDKNREWYTCGSTDYDQSISSFAVISFLVCLVVSYCLLAKLLTRSTLFKRCFADVQRILSYSNYYLDSRLIHISNLYPSFTHLQDFGLFMRSLSYWFLMLTVASLLFSSPIYFLKGIHDSAQFVTHTHQYRWWGTVSYLSGMLPGSLLLVSYFSVLIYFCLPYI
jgi:hypothetical protein